MKNTIMYYYELEPKNIHQKGKNYYFYTNQIKYYFVPFTRPLEEARAIYELNREMVHRNMLVHEIILNKHREIVSMSNEVPFILMRLSVLEKGILKLSDLHILSKSSYHIPYNIILEKNNWPRLWENKIDYFEYQMSQMGKNYPIIRDSFNYFIGLAENAISYINDTIRELKPDEIDRLVLSHHRIGYNFDLYDFYNPLNIIVDHKVRDLAEYLKFSFFEGKFKIEELEEYFMHNTFSLYGYQMLFGRLLFPSFYFDIYEQIMNGNDNEKKILQIIDKVEEYEEFLREMYWFIKKRAMIKEINWLIKK